MLGTGDDFGVEQVAIWEEGRDQMATEPVGLAEQLRLKGQVQKGGLIRLVV